MNCHLIILLIRVSISKLTHAQFTTSDIVKRCLRYHICLRSSFNQYSSDFQHSLHFTHLCNHGSSIVLKISFNDIYASYTHNNEKFDLDIFVKFAMRLIQNWQWYTCFITFSITAKDCDNGKDLQPHFCAINSIVHSELLKYRRRIRR